MKCPLVKDIPAYYRDGSNWVDVKTCPDMRLSIQRLKHTSIIRLVALHVPDYYGHEYDSTIAVNLEPKKDYGRFNYPYSWHDKPNAEIISAVRSQWKEDGE